VDRSCAHETSIAQKYGVPVGSIAAPPQAQEWEYCEVTWSERGFLANVKSYFWAQDIVTGDEL
jgi:hypothetical protein